MEKTQTAENIVFAFKKSFLLYICGMDKILLSTVWCISSKVKCIWVRNVSSAFNVWLSHQKNRLHN